MHTALDRRRAPTMPLLRMGTGTPTARGLARYANARWSTMPRIHQIIRATLRGCLSSVLAQAVSCCLGDLVWKDGSQQIRRGQNRSARLGLRVQDGRGIEKPLELRYHELCRSSFDRRTSESKTKAQNTKPATSAVGAEHREFLVAPGGSLGSLTLQGVSHDFF